MKIKHETVYAPEVDAKIDVFVLPDCQKLWAEGIKTFYACQGGPTYVMDDGSIYHTQAYIQILEKDAERVCEILADRNPTVFIHPSRVYPDRCSIDFDPSLEAMSIPVLPTRAERTPAG